VAVIPVFRPSARVIVSDSRDRILLFSYADAAGKTGWLTPGGGVQRGETAAAAAVRELAEETGIVVAASGIGPVVATSAGLWTAADGTLFFGADAFFFLRVASARVVTDGQEPLEASVITGHRWWTVAELRATADRFTPIGLPDLVARLITDGPPGRPVRLPWRLD
jgi:8-oxo-dGTP pyrophosphatase MutT (NUDIX family)